MRFSLSDDVRLGVVSGTAATHGMSTRYGKASVHSEIPFRTLGQGKYQYADISVKKNFL